MFRLAIFNCILLKFNKYLMKMVLPKRSYTIYIQRQFSPTREIEICKKRIYLCFRSSLASSSLAWCSFVYTYHLPGLTIALLFGCFCDFLIIVLSSSIKQNKSNLLIATRPRILYFSLEIKILRKYTSGPNKMFCTPGHTLCFFSF